MLTPNRIVAFLTPLVFAPLAGAITAWVAENAPGLDLSQERLTNVFIAGALLALAPALQWLYGWQKHEQREAVAQQAVELANSEAAAATLADEPAGIAALAEEADPDEADEDEALDALDEFEDADAAEEGDEFEDADAVEEGDEFEDAEDPLIGGEEEPVRAGV